MLPLPIQFLIATIAAAINERMARQLGARSAKTSRDNDGGAGTKSHT
jgi:hypothetical protein